MSEEPVAYLISQEPLSSVRWVSKDKPIGVDDKQITNLYTKSQLQPKVKMTKAEFDEFKQLFAVEDYASLAIGTIERVDITFNNLKNKIFSGSVNNRVKNENEFNTLWANYNPDNLEETIEIVKDKKQDEFFKQTLDRIVSEPKVKKVLEMLGDD